MQIAHNDFPIPILPQPRIASPPQEPHFLAPLPSSDPIEPPSSATNNNNDSSSSSQETNKENTNPAPPPPAPASRAVEPDSATTPEPGALPPQIIGLMSEITMTLTDSFPLYPPHTIQRLSELVVAPRQHYRSLASYLHALDRVVHVTSGSNIYPLPPAVPDMSNMSIASSAGGGKELSSWLNGGAPGSSSSSSSSSAGLHVGSDEALGGALLTPIPWLQRAAAAAAAAESDGATTSSPIDDSASSTSPTSASSSQPAGQSQPQQQQQQQQAANRRMGGEVRTESTETIDGPNGVGSIETVSVSVNGIPSHGAAAIQLQQQQQLQLQRGVTQGELLRQEQRAGVVPAAQLARQQADGDAAAATPEGSLDAVATAAPGEGDADGTSEEDEIPHARGPEEIGAADTGPQKESNYIGGLDLQGIDVEAAVGRKAAEPPAAAAAEDDQQHVGRSSTPKREADDELAAEVPSKKLREDPTVNEEGSTEPATAAASADDETDEAPKVDAEGDIVLSDDNTKAAAGEESADGGNTTAPAAGEAAEATVSA